MEQVPLMWQHHRLMQCTDQSATVGVIFSKFRYTRQKYESKIQEAHKNKKKDEPYSAKYKIYTHSN